MGVKVKDFIETVEVAYREKWGYIWATAGESWTAKKQANLEAKYHSDPAKYSDYRLGVLYGAKWIGHKVADCSGLVKMAAVKHGIKGIYHGSNSQFNKNCTKVGKIEKGVKIPVGALIFTGKEVGQHNHVGVLVDEKTVCEAHGTLKGVIHTPLSNRKWTYWGLMEGIDYENTPGEEIEDAIPETPVNKYPTLRRGARGDIVKVMQEALHEAGSTLQIDGIFGPGTQSAVRAFQKAHGLVVDGIVGPKTWGELATYM